MNRKRLWLQHIPLIFLIYLVIFQTFGAKWVSDSIAIPYFAQLVTICNYLPFAVFTGWLVISDLPALKARKLSLFSVFYYLFAIYFICLSGYRVIAHAEMKDSLYYVIVLYGSLSIAELIRRGHIPATHASLRMDVSLFAIFLCLYRLVFCLLQHTFHDNIMPINEIAMGAVLLFALVISADMLRKADTLACRLTAGSAILGIVLVIMTLSSRIMFAGLCLSALWLIVQFAIHKESRKHLYSLVSLFLCAVVIVFILSAANVGQVRYALYRATGISQSTVLWGGQEEPPAETEPDEVTEPEEKDESQISAENQIARSDALRTRLMKFGLEETKKNVLFGTGNVYLEIDDFGYYLRVPVHNGILQMLVGFGLLGMLLVLAMVVLWFLKGFPKPLSLKNSHLLSLILLIGLFCVQGMVQATSFNPLVLPAVMLCVSGFTGTQPEKGN